MDSTTAASGQSVGGLVALLVIVLVVALPVLCWVAGYRRGRAAGYVDGHAAATEPLRQAYHDGWRAGHGYASAQQAAPQAPPAPTRRRWRRPI